ncbi:hypothetical protein MK280_10985, partial [Myxococcota bacterium]|nr:hypothetical protein [Myxococcota bacterium]
RRARIGRARGENEMLPGSGEDLYYFDDEDDWEEEDSESGVRPGSPDAEGATDSAESNSSTGGP